MCEGRPATESGRWRQAVQQEKDLLFGNRQPVVKGKPPLKPYNEEEAKEILDDFGKEVRK